FHVTGVQTCALPISIWCVFKRFQTHVALGTIRSLANQLRCRFTSDGVVKLVLNHGEEFLGNSSVGVVIGTAFSKDISDLKVDTPLAGPNGSHPFEQFAEVVIARKSFSLFKAIIIKHKAFDHELAQ